MASRRWVWNELAARWVIRIWCWLLDGSTELGPSDHDLLNQTEHAATGGAEQKRPSGFNARQVVLEAQPINVSARTGEGLATLRSAILASLHNNGIEDGSLLITNARHYDLRSTERELEVARSVLREGQRGACAAPLHNALRFLGQITGETTTEDILSEIFATFCRK